MNRQLTIGVVLFLGGLWLGCVPEGNGDGDDNIVAIVPDAGTDSGQELDHFADFCARSSAAKCEYLFGCLQGRIQQIGTVFGMSGPMVSDCTRAAEADCLEDVRDRETRGTIDPIDPVKTENCLEWIEPLPCLDGPASEWADQFNTQYDNLCSLAIRGNVLTNGACEKRADCKNNKTEICLGGSCGAAKVNDLLKPCEELGPLVGSLSPDPSCDTGECVNTGNGGMCSLNCTGNMGCGGDPAGRLVCLALSTPGIETSNFCSITCTNGSQCGDFGCQSVNADEPDGETYCFGKAR